MIPLDYIQNARLVASERIAASHTRRWDRSGGWQLSVPGRRHPLYTALLALIARLP